MEPEVRRTRVAAERIGRLATVRADGRPHLVPCCFAIVGETIYTAVDAKPKSTMDLQRIDNVRGQPAVSLLVDHYEEDWSRLWWVRVDGRATIVGADARIAALAALAAKYAQYRTMPPPGPVMAIAVHTWRGWP